MIRLNCSRRALLGAPALALALLAGSLATDAHASITYCRTDPTVTLSNGVTVTMWAQISTNISSVSSVNYVLHVPAGVTLKSVTYDTYGYLEHLQIVADQSGTHYADNTTVTLTSGNTSVTAYATRQDSTVASKTGTSPNTITLNWCT